MALKNYTSDVPVSRTLFEIEEMLIQSGVSGITKEYAPSPPGKVTAVLFHLVIDANRPPVTVRLPANEEGALNVLWKQYVGADELDPSGKQLKWGGHGNKKRNRESFRQQAERTAWRIVKDWIAVELSRTLMAQSDFREVFLSYIWDGRQTFFERLKGDGFLALGPGKPER
jgi:hypothetical protein